MTIDNFFDQFIDGYLLSDLQNMYDLKPNNGDFGAAGYPMLITTLAGMELLGALTTDSARGFNSSSSAGANYFQSFWDNYLSVSFTEYSGLGRLFRQLVRNGISHIFLAKMGVMVTKGTGKRPIIDKTNRLIIIDANKLYDDFNEVVDKKIRPLLSVTSGEPSSTSMQAILDQIEQSYGDSMYQGLYDSLSVPTTTITSSMTSGASLSAMAVTGTFTTTVNPVLQSIFDGSED